MIFFIVILLPLAGTFGYRQCCPEETYFDEWDKCIDPTLNSTEPDILDCTKQINLVNGSYNYSFYLKDDGLLEIKLDGNVTLFESKNSDTYCTSKTKDNELIIVWCLSQEPGLGRRSASLLIIISGVFFAATALIYLLLPELRDLQGKIIGSSCIFGCLGWSSMTLLHEDYSEMDLCAITGFTAYFLIILSFFWMNALAIQVFRSVKYPNGEKCDEFKYYALYAGGVPVTLLICAVTANYIPGSHYSPQFGGYACWFTSVEELWIFMFGPLAVILLVNCTMFAMSIYLIWNSSKKRPKTLVYKVWMSSRLFVVVGIMWALELASSLSQEQHFLWIFSDIYNLLQGVMVFFLLVLRRRVIRALSKRGLLCNLITIDSILVTNDEEDQIIEQNNTDDTFDIPLDN